ncbi:MAG: hypothetical protein PHP57_13430 [Sideroxydans sp.]|nr:hypothetical protein [Sideroxydans sp.]
MASEVDIANLSLGHLGDSATISNLNPPEGSAQAQHAARFYPIARDSLLEMHAWGFATRRTTMASLPQAASTWLYCYAIPNDAINLLSVLPNAAQNDYSVSAGTQINNNDIAVGSYVPVPYTTEVDAQGNKVILTNELSPVLRYTSLVTDTTRFSPLFTTALSWHLASFLAGPILKGEVGAAEAKRCVGMMNLYLGMAKESDANQRSIKPTHNVGWMAGR